MRVRSRVMRWTVLLPGGDDPGGDLADLRGRHRSRVIGRAEADCIQRQRPVGASRLQRRHDRVRPARDQLCVALPPREREPAERAEPARR